MCKTCADICIFATKRCLFTIFDMIYLLKILIACITVFAVSLLPLIGAYDYEASVWTAVAALIFVPMLTPESERDSKLAIPKSILAATVYFIFANASVILAAYLRDEFCRPMDGVMYQLLIALPSVLLTSFWWGWTAQLAKRKRFRVPVYLLLPLLDLGFTLYALYNWPPIVAFGQFFGYFAGSIYDESIQVIQSLAFYRIGTGLLILCLIAGQCPHIRMVRRLAMPVLGILIAAGYHFFLSSAGILPPVGREKLAQTLWQTVESPDHAFRVHFLPKSKDRRSLEIQKSIILRNYTKDYRYLESFFQTRPPASIDIWVYPDARVKGRFIGAERTSFARVWKSETHLVQTSPDGTLARHEMSHLFAASFGQPPLRVAGAFYFPAIGWIEGLAMAAEWPINTYSLHTWSHAILQNRETFGDVSVSSLLYGFWSMPSRVAYTLAGSYVRYLIDRYGIEKVKQLSREFPGKFDEIIHVSAADSLNEWKKYISRFASDDAVALAPIVFGSSSIWTKKCARFRAKQEAEYYHCLKDQTCALDKLGLLDISENIGCISQNGGCETAPDIRQLEKLYAFYLERGPLQLRPLHTNAIRRIRALFPLFGDILYSAERHLVLNSSVQPENMNAAQLRTEIIQMLSQMDFGQLPPAARIIWLERRADMMLHAEMYYVASIIYRALMITPLPEATKRRIQIKAQAARYPESPVSQQIRIWFNTTPERRIAIAQQFVGFGFVSFQAFADGNKLVSVGVAVDAVVLM